MHTESTLADFAAGDTVLVDFLVPDPDGTDDCALTLSTNDTIRVLQVYPDGHCTDCIADAVATIAPTGHPPLHFRFDVVPLSQFNLVTSPSDSGTVYDPFTGAPAGSRCMLDYHIVIFGIANGYGGRGNDLSESAKAAVIAYARSGRGVVLTHDTIAKRHGLLSDPLTPCLDLYDYVHGNFNTLTPITGLDAQWVPCTEPGNIYNTVHRDPLADPAATILHYPFDLPESFDVTDCHAFGEHYVAGQVWYRGPEGQIYMHTYHDSTYDAFCGYFSTGHQEETDGTSFRPLEWETKAMINTMFYSFYGGRGNGIFTSAVIDAGCPVRLDSVCMGVDLPGSSFVVVEVRTSPDGTSWSSWHEVDVCEPISGVPEGRFVQYRLFLALGTPADDPPVVHWITLFGTQDIPEAQLVHPPLNSTTACSCGVVKFLVRSEHPLDLSGCRVEYDGTVYGSERLSTLGDTLIFTPPECFSDGEHHEGSLLRLVNSIGCVSEPESAFAFDVDLAPPTIELISPTGDTTGPDSSVVVVVVDSGVGVDTGSVVLRLAGAELHMGDPGVFLSGGTLTVALGAVGIELGGEVELCVAAADSVDEALCGPNAAESCWTFTVDTTAPRAELLSPTLTACESLSAEWLLYDDAGVDTSSISVVVEGSVFHYGEGLVLRGDTLTFAPGIELRDGETLSVRLAHVSDVFGNGTGFDEFSVVVDQSPPFVSISPGEGDSVSTPEPQLWLCIGDSIAGVDTGAIRLAVAGDTFEVGAGIAVDTCFVWNASSVGLSFRNGDTIHACLHVADLVPNSACGPNTLDTCWNVLVLLPRPVAWIELPEMGAFTSCSLQAVIAHIASGAALVEESLVVVVCGETLGTDDPRLELLGDSLVFVPDAPLGDGDTISFKILHAVDSLGASSDDLDSVVFFVDLSPPALWSSIADGDTVVGPPEVIYVRAHDEGCGTQACSLWIAGLSLGCAECESIALAPEELDLCLWEDTSWTLSLWASDCAMYCGANSSETSLVFFVADDDTTPPKVVRRQPNTWLADSAFAISVAVVESSGIYAPALPSDPQDCYILWDNDGELTADAQRAEMHVVATSGDTVFLESDTIPPQSEDADFVWELFLWDDDFDCERPSDRKPAHWGIDSVRIVPRPTVRMISPPEGCFSACSDIRVVLLVQSEDEVDLSSVVLRVAGETLYVPSGRVEVFDDTLVILPPAGGYAEGEVVVELLSAQTASGYNIPAQRWSFFVDLSPPSVDFIYPTPWAMLPEPDFVATVELSDDGAGVDTTSIRVRFALSGDTIDAASAAERYGDGWRVSAASAPNIAPGDTVEMVVYACDDVDTCAPNCTAQSLSFWIEPDYPCSLSTNPFTPNGDGINDVVTFFYPKPFSTRARLCIYDLGGREMFCRDIAPGDISAASWDGTRRGMKLPAGTYVYVIEGNGKILCRGTVTIAR